MHFTCSPSHAPFLHPSLSLFLSLSLTFSLSLLLSPLSLSPTHTHKRYQPPLTFSPHLSHSSQHLCKMQFCFRYCSVFSFHFPTNPFIHLLTLSLSTKPFNAFPSQLCRRSLSYSVSLFSSLETAEAKVIM